MSFESPDPCKRPRAWHLNHSSRVQRSAASDQRSRTATTKHPTQRTWGFFRARSAEHAATASEGKAIEARDQATKERDAKNDALAEKSAALTAEAAQRALADKQRELAERQLNEGLLRPIGYGL